ncbi:MAG: glutamate--tRNA ligase [Actinobacteria bacterium]|nr:glutamate--tRNA ligase [Actinomycetota bacterium]
MIKVRFAPSPTGGLHLGSARTALFNWLFARGQDGKVVLRIEDTDPTRSSREHEESICEDLRWLGLDWDEGPDVGGPCGPYRQSERGEIYREHASRLVESGRAYLCYCTPQELEAEKRRALAEGRTPLYSGTCRDLSRREREEKEAAGRKPALRFRVLEGEVAFQDLLHGYVRFPPGSVGDFIILRSDGSAGFNFSVVVDDAAMGITHVIRGEDHLTNTARHVLLFDALGYEPPMYLHHSLLLGPDGAKMSKRHGATTVREYREAGYLPAALTNYLAMLSWSPPEGREVLSLQELVRLFDVGDLSASPAVFDRARLDWLNGKHLRRLSPEELISLAEDFAPAWSRHPRFSAMVESILDNLTTLGDLPRYLEPYGEAVSPSETAAEWLHGDTARRVLERALELMEASSLESLEDCREYVGSLKRSFMDRDLKAREILMPLRVALTGRDHGPALPYLLFVLGPEECAARIRKWN